MKKQRAFSMSLTRGVIITYENTTAKSVAELMTKHNIGAVVIMKEGRVVGIVSERDIVRRVVAKGLPLTTKAKRFMTKEVVTADFRDGLDKIYQILCQAKFRHLPIMDGQKLVGIASQRDVLYGVTRK